MAHPATTPVRDENPLASSWSVDINGEDHVIHRHQVVRELHLLAHSDWVVIDGTVDGFTALRWLDIHYGKGDAERTFFSRDDLACGERRVEPQTTADGVPVFGY